MRRWIATAALALAGLTGCGGDEGPKGAIPPENADSMLSQLDGVRTAIGDEDCTKAQTDTTQFVAEVNELPEEAGVELKETLREAGQNLDDLVAKECADTGVTGEADPQPTAPTTTEETTPAPAPAPPPSDSGSDEEAPPEPPPGQGGSPPGGGNGAGGAGGDTGGVGEKKPKKPKSGHGSSKAKGHGK